MAKAAKPKQPDLVALAFELAAEQGWAGLRMAALAERAGLSLVELYRRCPDRGALLAELTRRLDEAMLAGDPAELADSPPRDRLFEYLMRRIDALQPHRAGVQALARDLGRDPSAVLRTLCGIERASRWLVDAAGVEGGGLRRGLARRALALAYLQTLRVWLRDDSADLAETMAELDRRLGQVASLGLIDATVATPAPAGG
jgi:AcrR family transcriptional regulator